MTDDQVVLVPAYREPEGGTGLFVAFEPGTRTLTSGFQVGPRFKPLPVDIMMDKDVAVTLRDGVTIHVDVLRRAGDEKVPVLVAWSPYGKSRGNAAQYVDLLSSIGLDVGKSSGLEKFEAPFKGHRSVGVRRSAPASSRSFFFRRTHHRFAAAM